MGSLQSKIKEKKAKEKDAFERRMKLRSMQNERKKKIVPGSRYCHRCGFKIQQATLVHREDIMVGGRGPIKWNERGTTRLNPSWKGHKIVKIQHATSRQGHYGGNCE